MSKFTKFVAASVIAVCFGSVGLKAASSLVAEYTVVSVDGSSFLTEQHGAFFMIKNNFAGGYVSNIYYEYWSKPTVKTPYTGTVSYDDLPATSITNCEIAGFYDKKVLLKFTTPGNIYYVVYKITQNALKRNTNGDEGVHTANTGESMYLDRSKVISVIDGADIIDTPPHECSALQECNMKFVPNNNKKISGMGELSPINEKTPQYWQEVINGVGFKTVRVWKYTILAEYTVEDGVDFMTAQNKGLFTIKNGFANGYLESVTFNYWTKPTANPVTGSLTGEALPVANIRSCKIAGFDQRKVLLRYTTDTDVYYVTYKITNSELKQWTNNVDGMHNAAPGETMYLDRSKVYSVINGLDVADSPPHECTFLQECNIKFVPNINKKVGDTSGELIPIDEKTCQYWQEVSGTSAKQVRVWKLY